LGMLGSLRKPLGSFRWILRVVKPTKGDSSFLRPVIVYWQACKLAQITDPFFVAPKAAIPAAGAQEKLCLMILRVQEKRRFQGLDRFLKILTALARILLSHRIEITGRRHVH